MCLPKERLLQVMAELPDPVPITGRAGTAVLFDCNLMHGSGHNLSRHPRWHVYFVYNRCANHPNDVPNPRPVWVRGQDWQPIDAVADDAILNAEKY
jgi:ectoine hydroxylase